MEVKRIGFQNVPIRQIQPLLIFQLSVPGSRSQGLLLPVLPPAVEPDEDHVDDASAPAADDGDLGGHVAGFVFGAERLWACNLLLDRD